MQAEQPKKTKFEILHQQIDQNIKKKWQEEQKYIRERIVDVNDFQWKLQNLDLVAGVDLSASKSDPNVVCAALVIYSCKMKKAIHEEIQLIQMNQPYIPGYLAFRQIPILLILFKKIKEKHPQYWPSLLLVDGNGILHQNMCGLACHLGVLVNIPSIGIGKTLFYIDGLTKQKVKQMCEKQIKKEGDYCYLKGDSGKVWGAGLRNSSGAVNPIFVSIGHKIQLDIAISCVMKLSQYRVVEPIRLADKRSRQVVQKYDLTKKNELPKFQMIYLKP